MVTFDAETKLLAKNSIVLFTIMMIGNLVNYIYQVVMGNILTIEDYGTWNALLALYTIANVPSGVFLMVSSRYLSRYKTTSDKERASRFVKRLFKVSIFCSLAIFVLGSILAYPVSCLLNIDNVVYVVITMSAVSLYCVVPVFSGALQGLSRFKPYGISSVVFSVGRLFFSVVFIAFGWGLYGAVGALSASAVCAVLYCLFELRKSIDWKSQSNVVLGRNEIVKCIGGAFWVQLILVIISNGDIMLIKALFSAQDAGVYSSGMVIAKISVYITGAVTGVLFPMAAASQAKNENTLPLLRKSLLFGGGLAVLCAVLLSILSEPVIDLLFGSRYLGAVGVMPYVCALAVAVALITILTNYLVAIGEESFFIRTSGIGIVLIIVGVSLFHENMTDVILVLVVVLSMIFIANCAQIAKRQSAKEPRVS